MQYLEIITIGLPFCAFKIIAGLYFNFIPLVVLGMIDLLINLTNLFTLIFKKKMNIEACLVSLIINRVKKPNEEIKDKWQDLGNSLDVLISFIIVAIIIGGRHIAHLSANQLTVWNISVILNVLGAGSSRMVSSLKNLGIRSY